MIKRFIGMFVTFAMILVAFPGYTSYAAANYSATNGSAVVYARDTDYSKASLWSDGYSKKSADSNTSGEYLYAEGGSSSTPSGSKLSFTVKADEAGRYALWARAKATSSNGATWVNVNDEGYVRKDLNTKGEWNWVKLSGGVYLESGESVSIKLYPKDEGHSIDEFILTNKSTYLPVGIVTDASSIRNTTLTADYGIPSITPPAEHPRVMFRASDVKSIIANSTKSQNTTAKSYLDTLVSTSFSGTVSGADSSDRTIENYIEANAFYYAIYGDEEKGRLAVNELINYLKTVNYTESNSQYSRYIGCTAFKAAEVYDWCYGLLTNDEKQLIIDLVEGILTGMEVGYPNIVSGNITGHGSEAHILRDLLSFGIAVYDERPDIYNHVMGKIEKEMVPARNYYYKSNSVHQGSSYGYYRFYWDLWAEKLVLAMSGQSLFSEDMAQVGYYMIYSRRPDGRMFIQGDDASLEWQHYNGHSAQTAFFAGALFNNEYFKGEYRNTRNSEDFTNTNFKNDKSFNSVFWLIVNNPDVAFKTDRSTLAKSRYFASPNGTILAKTGWDYTRSDSSDNNVASAMMKIGERYASNHDHLDAGTFQLFYRGMLASDSGVYDEYGTTHDAQYAKRTIAHNALTIYDPTEKFSVLGNGTSNDGGQKWAGEPKTFDEWMSDDYKRGKVLDHEIAADNSYSYIKGDITPAYSSEKADKVVRSMSFLQTNNSQFPAIMVIYDNVVSKTSSQTKKFLIHTQAEPIISGNTTTVVNNNTITYSSGSTAEYNGRMTMNTLLPENATITKIGGNKQQYMVNGTNYAPTGEQSYHEGGWGRVEVAPSEASTSTEFLNVLAVSDGGCTETVSSTLVRGTNVVGAKTLNNVVLFSNQTTTENGRVESNAEFTVDGDDEYTFTVFGLKSGNWIIKKDGVVVTQKVASENGASISFKGTSGSYVLSYGAMVYEPFSTENVSTGYVTEVKGTSNNSTWLRAHGGGGTSRTSVSMQAKTTVTSATAILNAHDTSGTGYVGRFVHSTFRISSDAAFQIRVRNGGSNIQWMNFKSDGTMNANSSSAVNFGVKWTPGKEHRYDIIADLQTGTGYLYIDGVLASKSFNLQTNGKWYGYLIYTSGTWVSGNTLLWKYYGNSSVAYTLFNDTEGHSVTMEDVITHSGISDKLSASDDEKLIMRDNRVKNYFIPQNSVTADYTNSDSVSLTMSSSNIAPALYMLSGFYHDSATTGMGSTINVGGRWLRATFDQTIEQADKTQIRLRSDGTNYFGINFHPADGKMAVSVDYDEEDGSTVLDKNWNDKLKVDILVDTLFKKAYYFVDGKQIGGASSYSDSGEPILNDIRYYIQGQNATVKLENCEYKVYNLKKEFNELYAQITNNPVYWTENRNTLEVDGDYIGMCITAKNAFGSDVVTGGKVIAAAYDRNNHIVDVRSWDYADGVSNEEVVFERNDISVIKTYCWVYPQLMPLAETQEFHITDYID